MYGGKVGKEVGEVDNVKGKIADTDDNKPVTIGQSHGLDSHAVI